MLQKVIAGAIALFVAFAFISVLMTLFKLAIAAIFNIVWVVMLLVFAIPVYIIAKKLLFK